MAARLTLPFSNGRTHAPTISKSPGCNHSRVIVVLAAHEPELSNDFRHDDNRDAGSESVRSEEHTSELQSQSNLVCRLLLEKKKKTNNKITTAGTQTGSLFATTF